MSVQNERIRDVAWYVSFLETTYGVKHGMSVFKNRRMMLKLIYITLIC